MSKRDQWKCVSITRKLHALTESDYSNVLAELWDLLVKQKHPISEVLVPAKIHSSRLSKPNRSYDK